MFERTFENEPCCGRSEDGRESGKRRADHGLERRAIVPAGGSESDVDSKAFEPSFVRK